MSQPYLSIIIPAYNCAQYLVRAVESAVAFCNVVTEVLVVDDGSTDNTSEVMAQLLARFPSLQLLKKVNGGLSSARNHGLDRASGRYALFLDADDELIPIGKFPDAPPGAEMIRLGVEELAEDGAVTHHVIAAQVCSGRAHLAERFAKRQFFAPSWAYLYDLRWLRGTGLRFVHGLIHEDMLFTVEALLACRQFAACEDLAYRYFRRAGSITTTTDPVRIRRRLESLATICKRLTTLANETPEVDVGWWVLNSINYAESLAAPVHSRSLLWRVAMMEFRFFLTYRAWGSHRSRRDVRFRLRQRVERALALGHG